MQRKSNVEIGRRFQELVRQTLSARFGEPFDDEVFLDVGDPPKPHRFDLASRSRHIVSECKAYTWTAGGNTPSAKISNLKEAVQYLRLLPDDATKVLAVLKTSAHRNERR